MSEYIGEIIIILVLFVIYIFIKYIDYKRSQDVVMRSKKKKDLINGTLSLLVFTATVLSTALLFYGLNSLITDYNNEIEQLESLTTLQTIHGLMLIIAFILIVVGFIYVIYKFVIRGYVIKFIKYTGEEKELQKKLDIEWHNKLSRMPLLKYIFKEKK